MLNKKRFINLKNYIFSKENKTYIYLLIFYSLAHIWILFLSNALFWDDWSIYNSAQEINYQKYFMAGNPFFGLLHNSILKFGLPIYRYLTFIIFFINSIFLNKILKRANFLNSDMRFGLCLLYLTTPFYIARVTIICFQYTFGVFLFFAAWFLLNRFRVISIFLFLISFTTNSLLVFYLLPIIEDFFIKFKSLSLGKYIKQNIFLLSIPFGFYIFKRLVFKPFGMYEGYLINFDIKNLFSASFDQLIDALRLQTNFILLLPLLVLLISFILYRFIFFDKVLSDKKNAKKLFIFGLIAFISGVFPYWILNYSPSFNGWLSRHQLLMPLGVAILIVSILLNFNMEGRRVLLSLFVSIFLIINISNYFALISDNIKQNQIVEILKNKIDIQDSDFIIFDDKTNNALDRKYRFYEWNGLLQKAYPNDSKIGINKSQTRNELNFIADIFKANLQKYYGITSNCLPDEIKISKLKIIYSSSPSPIYAIKNILYRLKNFNTKPIKIEVIDNYKVNKTKLITDRDDKIVACQISEKNNENASQNIEI